MKVNQKRRPKYKRGQHVMFKTCQTTFPDRLVTSTFATPKCGLIVDGKYNWVQDEYWYFIQVLDIDGSEQYKVKEAWITLV